MKIDSNSTRGRAPLFVGVTLVCAGALLSGCMGSPTYGTSKTSSEQLVDDLTGILDISPKRTRVQESAYSPRPGLVRPSSLEVLPEPQQRIATAGNPAWPESPEQRRARIRADATANQDNPLYRSQVASSGTRPIGSAEELNNRRNTENSSLTDAQRADMTKRVRERNQGDSNSRRFLTEPPVSFRKPEETAAYGELGEDELAKERKLQRASGKSGGWRSLVPWL